MDAAALAKDLTSETLVLPLRFGMRGLLTTAFGDSTADPAGPHPCNIISVKVILRAPSFRRKSRCYYTLCVPVFSDAVGNHLRKISFLK